jgi:hypothetical protein
MKASVARALTRLYSPSWRARYADEFEAVLEELELTPGLIADIVPKALVSRPALSVAFAIVVLLVMMSSAFHGIRPEPKHLAIRPSLHRVVAERPCRVYSSTSATFWEMREQCLG